MKYDSLAEVITQLRKEIGLPKFALEDNCICNLYISSDIQFKCKIYSITTSHNVILYLVDCPQSIGYHPLDLLVKLPLENPSLNDTLFYRWTEENTLILID